MYEIKLPTCVEVARYFLSSLVLINCGVSNPGQLAVTCRMAAHPSKGKSVCNREKTCVLLGATPQ